jgi:hypothetical protein
VAREVIEKLIDDLDGGDAAETVTFGLDGATYEIDLSKKNAAVFRKSLAPYVNAARPSTAPSRSTSRTAPSRSTRRRAAPSTNGSKPKRDFDILQLREWAGANKVAVPARGRIPNSVVEQYKQARGR